MENDPPRGLSRGGRLNDGRTVHTVHKAGAIFRTGPALVRARPRRWDTFLAMLQATLLQRQRNGDVSSPSPLAFSHTAVSTLSFASRHRRTHADERLSRTLNVALPISPTAAPGALRRKLRRDHRRVGRYRATGSICTRREIMIEMNNVSFSGKPAKLAYMWRDIERWAAMYGLPPRGPGSCDSGSMGDRRP